MRTRWAPIALLVVAATACGGGGEGAASTGSTRASTSASVTAQPTSSFPVIDESELLSMSQPVTFEAADGVALEGRLFGSGDVGVVLSHMRPGDQGQWLAFAGLLADHGYRVLTFDRRGECPGADLGCSEGNGGAQERGGTWRRRSRSCATRARTAWWSAGRASGRWNRCTRSPTGWMQMG